MIVVDGWDRGVDGRHTPASKSRKWKIELFVYLAIYC
jgi:hypothetical protein